MKTNTSYKQVTRYKLQVTNTSYFNWYYWHKICSSLVYVVKIEPWLTDVIHYLLKLWSEDRKSLYLEEKKMDLISLSISIVCNIFFHQDFLSSFQDEPCRSKVTFFLCSKSCSGFVIDSFFSLSFFGMETQS